LAGDIIEIQAPAHLGERELAEATAMLVRRLERYAQRSRLATDEQLWERAQLLNRRYFGGQVRLTSIQYVDNQARIFGSCTPHLGSIRLSRRLATLPEWVRDYVIVHELAYLVYAHHGARFWDLVHRYPLAERARGYLMAIGLEERVGEEDDPCV